MSISTIITAAGKNSRMRKDQISRNMDLKNKLILPFMDKTVLETTIDNALSANIDECIVVLGHYAGEIMEAIGNNYEGSVKFIHNNPVDVGLSTSLFNGLANSQYDYALCITGDQPTVSAETFNKMIEVSQNSENPEKNPILRKIFDDGYTFYGIKEKNKKELLNINHYEDYLSLLD